MTKRSSLPGLTRLRAEALRRAKARQSMVPLSALNDRMDARVNPRIKSGDAQVVS